MNEDPVDDGPVAVSGIHLFRSGDHAVVKVEIDGQWFEVIKEFIDSPFCSALPPAPGSATAAPFSVVLLAT